MRGELDDALNRMARMEALSRRRAGDQAGQRADERSSIAEAIEAIRQVVAQHPRLRVALWAEEGATGVGVRVEWLNGELIVLHDDEPPPPPNTGAAAEPIRVTAESPVRPRPAEPVPPASAPPHPGTSRAAHSEPVGMPLAPRSEPIGTSWATRSEPISTPLTPRSESAVPVPAAWQPPPPVPTGGSTGTTWAPDPETDAESAARLAELIRRDPSLLRAPEDPYPRN
ncbi:hypothetical protein [Plantactinospora sp. KBS50]|uniref:hypothetical protein n=1 Tax=Plantactinospora sp. KBS50 TaxID=2024580 RepID=UPI000BAAA35B|nr:hypothetical protein [Plantactinospora sp. KBS50]ASW56966.1 hypothetical protein CIK06_26630 [Plantactinospora sp. KBS50]